MLNGSDIIVLSVEDAERLLTAIRTDWGRARVERLQKLGVLDAASKLEDAVKRAKRGQQPVVSGWPRRNPHEAGS